jgi:hypothetical protein
MHPSLAIEGYRWPEIALDRDVLRSLNIRDDAIPFARAGRANGAGISGISPLYSGILVTSLIPRRHHLKGNLRALNRIFMDWAGY